MEDEHEQDATMVSELYAIASETFVGEKRIMNVSENEMKKFTAYAVLYHHIRLVVYSLNDQIECADGNDDAYIECANVCVRLFVFLCRKYHHMHVQYDVKIDGKRISHLPFRA